MNLSGEIALITGGSRGIGKACALALAEAGAEVLINYNQNQAKAEEICETIRKKGGIATAVGFDVSNIDATQTAIESILKEKKKISIVVNNAGITHDRLLLRYPIDE
jgi:3-oxoacyl-[acyl-carrier protein] reductase